MTTQIAKGARAREVARTPVFFYGSAREGMSDLLRHARGGADSGGVLLPNYIGWSAREGSGVLDPVRASGRHFDFYDVQENLEANLESVLRRLETGQFAFLVLIHYFGRIDPNVSEVKRVAEKAGVVLIEDLAHGFFTAMPSARVGPRGDVAIYSLHKQLALIEGGMAVYFDNDLVSGQKSTRPDLAIEALSYDWHQIAQLRRRNYDLTAATLRASPGYGSRFRLLWPELTEGDVAQSLPVLLRGVDRDRIYTEMNASGYGMVSLYHTLDSAVRERNPAAMGLSRRIINFPVHQDVPAELIPPMIARFVDLIQQHEPRME